MAPTFHFLMYMLGVVCTPLALPHLLSYLFLPPLILHPSPPKPKNVANFDFFDAHIWSYLHVFGPPLSYPLDVTQLRAPYLHRSLPVSTSFPPDEVS